MLRRVLGNNLVRYFIVGGVAGVGVGAIYASGFLGVGNDAALWLLAVLLGIPLGVFADRVIAVALHYAR